MMALLHDFGLTASVTAHTDASAAIGIVRRAGLGKLRHLNVRYLWVQDQVKRGRLWLEKVAGADNPADLATKNLSADVMRKHLESLGVHTGGARARSAPLRGSLGRRGRRRHTSGMGPQKPGGWSTVGTESGAAEARIRTAQSVGPQRPGGGGTQIKTKGVLEAQNRVSLRPENLQQTGAAEAKRSKAGEVRMTDKILLELKIYEMNGKLAALRKIMQARNMLQARFA